MAARIDIPLTFPNGAPPTLKRDLERLANGVYAYTQAAPQLFAARPETPPRARAFLSFDSVVPFALVDGVRVDLSLPRADPRNGGRRCGIIRKAATGMIVVSAVGCLVDGTTSYTLSNALGYTEFLFDGTDYWSSRAGIGGWA